ncbi:hypothetical protein L873DRAFT_1801895 [Choiromyces venosus 120613-1]|uniref:Uncharacterized protein n=1 Tax=Choiromyces venosus 120613-1 TaxID=1336337 RepID=A0A3N4JVU2_9PEZI|nr:hypothetical protein L873DRAFT_1801895 [Choiromyces venosus 120613-1]
MPNPPPPPINPSEQTDQPPALALPTTPNEPQELTDQPPTLTLPVTPRCGRTPLSRMAKFSGFHPVQRVIRDGGGGRKLVI